MTIQELRQALLSGIFDEGEIPAVPLTTADWQQINQISGDRYQQWDWNIGHSPEFNVQNSERFPAGKIEVRIHVVKGRIQTIKFLGDFSGLRDVVELERRLVDVRYERAALVEALDEVNINLYLGDLAMSELLALLY